jgi:RNase P/RNase MRP subunit p30
MINTQNLQHAKEQIKKSNHPIIVLAQDYEFNRKLCESGKFDILLSIERITRKDKLRQLDSGLNHVLAKSMTKNKIALGIDLKELRNLQDKKEKAQVLGRIIQNIKLCRKAKTQIKLLNFKDVKDAKAFLLSLGASTEQLIL